MTQAISAEFKKIERFLERIRGDVYPEPQSQLHSQLTDKMFDYFMLKYGLAPASRVLDIGCGQGAALALFKNKGLAAMGITIGREDLEICRASGFDVYEMDQSFLEFEDNCFDFIWCRHCLEHSIFPYYTLSEFQRVLKPGAFLYVEVPAPETSCSHQNNPNHYSVLGKGMWLSLFQRSGFQVLDALDIKFQVMAGEDLYWAFIQQKKSAQPATAAKPGIDS